MGVAKTKETWQTIGVKLVYVVLTDRRILFIHPPYNRTLAPQKKTEIEDFLIVDIKEDDARLGGSYGIGPIHRAAASVVTSGTKSELRISFNNGHGKLLMFHTYGSKVKNNKNIPFMINDLLSRTKSEVTIPPGYGMVYSGYHDYADIIANVLIDAGLIPEKLREDNSLISLVVVTENYLESASKAIDEYHDALKRSVESIVIEQVALRAPRTRASKVLHKDLGQRKCPPPPENYEIVCDQYFVNLLYNNYKNRRLELSEEEIHVLSTPFYMLNESERGACMEFIEGNRENIEKAFVLEKQKLNIHTKRWNSYARSFKEYPICVIAASLS